MVSFFRAVEALVSGVVQVVVSPAVGIFFSFMVGHFGLGVLFLVFVLVYFLPCSELADEPDELKGHQDLLLTPLVFSDCSLRTAPTMHITEKWLDGTVLVLQLLS